MSIPAIVVTVSIFILIFTYGWYVDFDIDYMIAVPVVIVLAGYIRYVDLVKRSNKVREALASIDVQLRKRHDLLPNVLKIANKFMTHERDLLTKVTELRSRAMADYHPEAPEEVRRHLEAEGALQVGMGRLMAVAESYPELRSQEPMIGAQQTFREVEEHVAAARRFYNAAVNRLNNAIEIFPGVILAALASVYPMPFFEIEDEEVREPIDAAEFLK